MSDERYAMFRWRLVEHDEALELAQTRRRVSPPRHFNRPPGSPDGAGVTAFEDGSAIAASAAHATRHPDVQPSHVFVGELEPDSEWRPGEAAAPSGPPREDHRIDG